MRYPDFKSYLADVYKENLAEAIQDFLNNQDGRHGYPTKEIHLVNRKIENIEITFLSCHTIKDSDFIKMDATTSADTVEMLPVFLSVEESRHCKNFIISMICRLKNGMHDFQITDIKNAFFYNPDPEDSLDEFLIPYISNDEFEDIADEFSEKYCDHAYYGEEVRFPADEVMRELGIKEQELPLPKGTFGRMYFKEQNYFIFDDLDSKDIKIENTIVKPGTLIVNEKECLANYGSRIITVAHEIIHWTKHRNFFELLLLIQDRGQVSCETGYGGVPKWWDSRVNKALWWAEWQANNLASRIVMPRRLFEEELAKNYDELSSPKFYGDAAKLEDAINKTAISFDVSPYAVKVRAIQLGINEAAGTLIENGKYAVYPISFKRESLLKNESYDICLKSFNQLLVDDESFSILLESERYVYAEESFVVFNDPLYVKKVNHIYGEDRYELTSYGRKHAEECCMKFKLNLSYGKYELEYYGQCFLSKQLDSSVLQESKLEYSLCDQDLKQREIYSAKLKEEGRVATSIYRKLPNSFCDTLDFHMNRLKNKGLKMTNKELYERTGISENYIGRLRNDETANPSLQIVCAISVGLKLPPIFSMDLIRKSKNDFPDDENGYYQKRLLEECYSDSLDTINDLLRREGIKEWKSK